MDRQIPLEGREPSRGLPEGGRIAPEGTANSGRKRRSWFRRTLGGVAWLSAAPVDWMGWRTISGGAALLGRLYQRTRASRRRDSRFKMGEGRAFDVAATAFAHGITQEELERRLGARRRQTATLAYGMFGLACMFVLAWVCVALRTASDGGRVVLLLEFLPFCLLFYLMSFYQALINFQIRTGRAAGWREYLSTDGGFLPRW